MKPPKPPNTLPSTTGSEYHLIASAHQALVEIFKAIPPNHLGIKEINSAMLYLKAATEYCRTHHNICRSIYWQKAAASVRFDISEQLDRLRTDIAWNLQKFLTWWKKFEDVNKEYLDDWTKDYCEKLPEVRQNKKNIPELADITRRDMTLRAQYGLRQLYKCQQLYSQKLLEASK
jgi:hypothetical protein